MTIMAKTYHKAIYDMLYAQDQRLADMARSQEMNMACILELIQQGNIGAVEQTLKRHGSNLPLALIHENHHMEERVDSATAAAAAAVPVVVNGDPEASYLNVLLLAE
ncbi:hypothetical protein Syun_014256 [Stephania yunnanensis]|uniref:Uncharacterized protein n=1 Tax=Stephania yunnanensis TaxID=152371 RepID=A0AAP0JK24_9MAGN